MLLPWVELSFTLLTCNPSPKTDIARGKSSQIFARGVQKEESLTHTDRDP